jgi:two-component system, OmpR family, sensor histidine kinase BaeS
MLKSLQAKFLFLLLGVAAVALSGTLVLRELMLRDFRAYLEGEAEDKVYLIQADLESAYERQGAWRPELQGREALRTLMAGFEMKLLDQRGELVTETRTAIAAASPLVKKRLEAIARFNLTESPAAFVAYPLFLAGSPIGTLEVRQLHPVREDLFLSRSNRFMILSILVVGGLAVLMSILFSRRLTRPVRELALAASAISRGDMQRRVAWSGRDELGDLAAAFNHMAKALETQEMLRRRLIADVAHELRTPLAVMQAELEGMLDGLLPHEPGRLQSLHDETGRLKNIVSAIEELNKAEASSLSLHRQPIELKSFLEGIAERYRTSFQEKEVGLEVDCPHEHLLDADPERLSQIVLNLLSNALKATDREGRVTMSVEASGGGLSLTVADTGSGIGEEDLPFIFERFYRNPGGGLGIGLAIVKELVEAHGARVQVTTTPGRGSSFTVHFPREDVHNVS